MSDRKIKCYNCDGEGGHDKFADTCYTCGGRGLISAYSVDPYDAIRLAIDKLHGIWGYLEENSMPIQYAHSELLTLEEGKADRFVGDLNTKIDVMMDVVYKTINELEKLEYRHRNSKATILNSADLDIDELERLLGEASEKADTILDKYKAIEKKT